MKKVKLKDLELAVRKVERKEEKFIPKFLGMKEKDIHSMAVSEEGCCGYDENDNPVYTERSDGSWTKSKYDENGNEIFYEDSESFWCKRGYDENGNNVSYKTSSGCSHKKEFDEDSNQISFENDRGEYWYYEDGKMIEKRLGNYFIDGKPAVLKNKD